MAKSKNATSHHNARKHHKHGITRLTVEKYQSLRGCNQRYIRNRRAAIKGDPSIKKNKNLQKRMDAAKKRNQKK